MGCGVISNTYIGDIKRLYRSALDIVAVADVDAAKAAETAGKYEISYHCSPDELLADPAVEIIVNLTPPTLHFDINKKILQSGKHVFCEKPFAMNLADAQATMSLAQKKGLYIGCAPDTFLGSGLQTCRKLIDDGIIGEPFAVTANLASYGVETWHPYPFNFYKIGGGPLWDMAPYYLNAIVSLLGPIKEISAFGTKTFEKRRIYSQPLYGQEIQVEIPTHYYSILRLESAAIINMTMSFDILKSNMPKFEIYGKQGTLQYPDPNMPGEEPQIFRLEQYLDTTVNPSPEALERRERMLTVPAYYANPGKYTCGIGVVDLAYAIDAGVPNRADGALACHVVEAIGGIIESADTSTLYKMTTTVQRPKAVRLGLPIGEWEV
jgi:predicted dehydrogenase